MLKVSVIIPVYNVEKYIEKCACSLFQQTLEDVEYIFVDDCSSDRSIELLSEVLKSFPTRVPYVKIIRNEENRQVAYTRTIGMKSATGEYMIHCDPDDYMDVEYLETMYNTAISTGSDIVASNYYRVSDGNKILVKNKYYSQFPQECIKNIYRCYFFPSLCSHMVKTSLFTEYDIYPCDGINSGEDLNVLLRVFHYAKKLAYVDKAYYYYVNHKSSLIHQDPMILWNNIRKNLKYIIDFFEGTKDKDYTIMLNYIKFVKKSILLSANPPMIKLWYNLYPECRKDIIHFQHLSITRKVMYIIFSYFYPFMWFFYVLTRRIKLFS